MDNNENKNNANQDEVKKSHRVKEMLVALIIAGVLLGLGFIINMLYKG